MTKILLVIGGGVLIALGLTGCQGPHPYKTVPPTSISVPSSGSAAGTG